MSNLERKKKLKWYVSFILYYVEIKILTAKIQHIYLFMVLVAGKGHYARKPLLQRTIYSGAARRGGAEPAAQGSGARRGCGARQWRGWGWGCAAQGAAAGAALGVWMELLWERGERRERGLNAVGKELFQNKNQFTAVVTLKPL
jgi:hypothetical protein